MSNVFSGTVVKVVQKAGKYSIMGDDENWYGCWTNNPGNIEGKNVTFSYKENGNFKNADTKTIKVIDNGGATATSAIPPTASVPSKAKYEPRRDSAIQIQGCRNTAVAFVGMAVQAGAVGLPAKKADQLDALEALVNIYAAKFYIDTDKVQANGGVLDDTVVDAVSTEEDSF
jgi:hypothetical protein